MVKLPEQTVFKRKSLQQLFASLDNNARLVGGCVRNALLDLEVSDIDIATPFKPDQVIEKLQKSQIKVVPTGLKFGTVTAVFNDATYEITTLRKDIDCDGRHAAVEFTDNYEEDAKRRDFTINAMSCDLEGNVYDYCGGLNDLKKSIIRFVGDGKVRCEEDFLRVLRFFRFYAYYGKGEFDQASLEACKVNAYGLDKLSGERIAKEMLKLLAAPNPYTTMLTMHNNNILKFLLSIEDLNLDYLLRLIELEGKYNIVADGLLRLAVIIKLHPQSCDWVVERWKLSNHDGLYLKELVGKSSSPENGLKDHLKLARGWGKGLYKALLVLDWVFHKRHKDSEYLNLLEQIEKWQVPILPIQGQDLLDIGYKPGKKIGQVLSILEKSWEDSGYNLGHLELIEQAKGLNL